MGQNWMQIRGLNGSILGAIQHMRDGSQPACEWLKSILPAPGKVIVMPGNHDELSVLWDVFGPETCVNDEFYFTSQAGGKKLIFADSSSDTLPEVQLEFLRNEGRESSILFIHHPPDLVSDGFMARNQPLTNHAAVSEVIRSSEITDVFCGHYHNSVDKDCDGFQLHVTPSPAFQIDLHSPEFKPESFEPAVRVIEVDDDSINTWLAYP